MAKYRKRPVVVDAHRIGDDGWPDEIWEGVMDQKILLFLEQDAFKQTIGHVEINTLEGLMRGNVGDYIVRGIAGEFYPCKGNIFHKTYEEVDYA